jgi:hypothetical protein
VPVTTQHFVAKRLPKTIDQKPSSGSTKLDSKAKADATGLERTSATSPSEYYIYENVPYFPSHEFILQNEADICRHQS